MKTFSDLTKQKFIIKYEKDFIGTLDESGAGLSRVLSKLDSNEDFLFITAARAENSKEENLKNNNLLIQYIREKLGLKIGAYKIIGHWKECSEPLEDNQTISDCNGTIKNSLEETWLIIRPKEVDSKAFSDIAIEVAKKYKQDAYVIRLDNKLTLNGKDGSVWSDLGKASKDSLSVGFNKIVNVQGYSELKKLRSKGRSANIVFESLYLAVPKKQIASKRLFSEALILY
jgi:hypothetical protein